MIKQIKKRNIKVRLYTSGNIETKWLDKSLSLGLDKIIFGVNSINPETHDYITQVPEWDLLSRFTYVCRPQLDDAFIRKVVS